MWAKIVSWLGIIVVIFVSLGLTDVVREWVFVLRSSSASPDIASYILMQIITAFVILLVFGLGAALMRANFLGTTVWKTIATFAIIFGGLGVIMGMTK